MGKKLVITPTCDTPEQGITGVLVNGNIFVPTYEMPGIIDSCGIQQKIVQPTMKVSWSDWTSFNGTYVEKGTYNPGNGTYNYYQKSDNTGWYIARYTSNKSRWCFACDDWGGMNTSNGLCEYYCIRSDNGTELQCPYDGYYDDNWYWTGGLTNAITDVAPRTLSCLVVSDCGQNATYIWNYLVALNQYNECNVIIMNQKTDVPYIEASITKTNNPVSYIADISVKDNVVGEQIDVITRCYFSKEKVIRYSTKRYVVPTYTISPVWGYRNGQILSGSSITATNNGSVTADENGYFTFGNGKYFDFDSQVMTGSSARTFIIQATISASNIQFIDGGYRSSSQMFGLGWGRNSNRLFYHFGGNDNQSWLELSAGSYMLAFVYNGSVLTVYKDGTVLGTYTTSLNTGTSYNYRIGQYVIDDWSCKGEWKSNFCIVFDRALTAEEIQQYTNI